MIVKAVMICAFFDFQMDNLKQRFLDISVQITGFVKKIQA